MRITDIHNILLAVLLFFSVSFAGTTGKIVGTVTDKDSGIPLVGVNIVLKGTSLGSSTDPEGYYAIINVPPGKYSLEIFYIGYATLTVENVKVNIDRTTKQNIELFQEILQGQTVVVEAERPAIELDRTHSSAVVSAEVVEYMPVTDVEEVLELQAGIVSSDGELHFRGGRAREVTYVVDGVPVTNSFDESGGSNITVETNMIAELEVISGTFNAEYGSAQSGIVNIVTKKPDNKFSGSVQTYIGEWLSDKDDIFIGVSNFNPLAEKDVQFSLSGPIIKDKLGFFLSARHNQYESLYWYEKRYNLIDGWRIATYQKWFDQHSAGDTTLAGVNYIPDSLKTGDGSLGPLSTGRWTSLNTKFVFTPISELTLTYQIIGKLEEFDGYYNLKRNSINFKRYQPDGMGQGNIWEISHFFKIQHSPWKNFFYNLSFSYQFNDGDYYYRKDNRVARYPGDEGIMPISYSSHGFSMGSTDWFYMNKDGKNFRDQYVFTGNFNWQVDKYNFLKTGFEIKKLRAEIFYQGFYATPAWASYAWPDQELINGAVLSYEEYWNEIVEYWRTWEDSLNSPRFRQAQKGDAARYKEFKIEPTELAFYLQDKIELKDVIINAGLRLDIFQPNEKVPINYRTESYNLGKAVNLKAAKNKYQLSPRIGLSFPISANGAFHGSYGHFFQMPAYERMYNEPLVTLTPYQLSGRRLGNSDLKAERTIAYEIGLQQGITDEIAVDVTAFYKDFRNLLGIEQLTTVDLIQYERYINRDYGYSKGITLGFTKRGKRINGGLNYTMSFANGSSSDPGSLNLINTAIQYGGEDVVFVERKVLSLDWDQRHTINAYVNFIQPDDWSIGLVGYYNSGVPFSPTFVGRYDIAEREYRNSDFKPTRWSIDLKVKKNIDIFGVESILFLKIDNLFDHLNHERVFSSTGRADQKAELPEEKQILIDELEGEGHFTYDEVTFSPYNYSDPRKIQLGMEVKF